MIPKSTRLSGASEFSQTLLQTIQLVMEQHSLTVSLSSQEVEISQVGEDRQRLLDVVVADVTGNRDGRGRVGKSNMGAAHHYSLERFLCLFTVTIRGFIC